MLPEFMNLLRKFYFMRAAARSVKIEIILFRQTEASEHTSPRLEAVEKLSFSEQPLARNHAFERILKKNRALRAHFFFPCINSEIHKVNCRIAAREGGLGHAPGIYEFDSQILFYACCRTKRKN